MPGPSFQCRRCQTGVNEGQLKRRAWSGQLTNPVTQLSNASESAAQRPAGGRLQPVEASCQLSPGARSARQHVAIPFLG
ncbi:uncharacterized [Tachysurus ichikawai]